jgi:hypothetical protein
MYVVRATSAEVGLHAGGWTSLNHAKQKNVLIIAEKIIIIYNPGQGVAIFGKFSKVN